MSPARDSAKYMRERRARLSDHLTKRLQLGDHLKKTYGLTLAQYDELLRTQGGVCAVCECPPNAGRRLHVDHDHETGAVRALLCAGCNSALGLMDENPLLLQQLASYAEHCVQRRAGFVADPTDPHRHAITMAYRQDPHVPHLANEMREGLQRLYAKSAATTKRRRDVVTALEVRAAAEVARLAPIPEVAQRRVGGDHDAVFV